MPVSRERIIYRNFIISTSMVIAVVLSGIFLNMAVRTGQLMTEENLVQARILFKTILVTRQWNAKYGGVYVEKKPGVPTNPYLRNPDIRTVDGRVLTKRNPALMTLELSEFAAREGSFKFHLTSLNLINPANKPDAFETSALKAFDRGTEKEVSRVERIGDRSYFRYMAPLYVEEDCLQCHRKQGYKLGNVRGGISISFDIEDLQRKIRHNTVWIILFGITTTASLLGLIFFFTALLIRRLAEARSQIELIAITDHLTGLYNRRYLFSRFREEFEKVKRLNTSLCCIMADIDHFKAVNDRYGHLAGDEVLKQVAQLLKSMVRAYDIVGRYGGEEFLVILPETRLEDARYLAERIRVRVKEEVTATAPITISLGVTMMLSGDEGLDDIIKRADKQLYLAKNGGRDKVE